VSCAPYTTATKALRYSQVFVGHIQKDSAYNSNVYIDGPIVFLENIPLLNNSMNPSLRAAVIAEWRGLPEKKTRADRWQSPAELMPKLMQRLGLRERLRETEVIDAWSKIVGDFIAAHSSPVALREGILYVRVLQPALHYELEQISKTEIVRKLKQRFGGKTIRDVRFRVG
jgi:Dna[CI] antecedent, DciA